MANKKQRKQQKDLQAAPVMPATNYYKNQSSWWRQREEMLNNIYGSATYNGPFNK